jgi:hypothetical protein
MTPLVISTTCAEWHAIKTYAAARRAELLDEVLSLVADDRERRDAAVRIDELEALLRAPEETRREAQARQDGQESARKVY